MNCKYRYIFAVMQNVDGSTFFQSANVAQFSVDCLSLYEI